MASEQSVRQWYLERADRIQYFSYRNRFPTPLANGGDHDAGWGCMARTGQMMMCEALRRVLPLGDQPEAKDIVVDLFHDMPSAPFSLHKLTDSGATHHVAIGTWFNATGLAFSLRDLVAHCDMTSPLMGVVIGQDSTVVLNHIYEYLQQDKSVVVFIPLMLGIEKISQGKIAALLKTFELSFSLGIVGGRPKHSLYFFGYQRDQVFYMDPHTVQPAFVSRETLGAMPAAARASMSISDLDASMLLCFCIRSRDEADKWVHAMERDVFPLAEFPLFTIKKPKKKAAGGGGGGVTSSPSIQQLHQQSSPSSSSSKTPPPRSASAATTDGDAPRGPNSHMVSITLPTLASQSSDDVFGRDEDVTITPPAHIDDCAFDDDDLLDAASDKEMSPVTKETTPPPPPPPAAAAAGSVSPPSQQQQSKASCTATPSPALAHANDL